MKKVILVILDGFGHSDIKEHNAIALAKTPNYSRFLQTYPHSLIETSGLAVGLPPGIMGNSEVGHLSIGSGRVIYQEMTRISQFAETEGFESLQDFKRVAADPNGALHLIGLCSDGGVHSDIAHIPKMLEAVARVNPKKPVYIHAITDGRDTPPQSGAGYMETLERECARFPNVKIATVIGRFYAMDRDKRWDRVETAYRALTVPGEIFVTAKDCVLDAYKKSENDEFIKPRQVRGGKRIAQDDQVIFFNFRADRAREISQAFGFLDFKEFSAPVKVAARNWVTFTRYQESFPFPYLFHPQKHTRLLGELVAEKGLKQLRIAETEKYAHVTYFFNGGEEAPNPGEERILVPSAKEVPTYDLKPEMGAYTITEKLIAQIEQTDYALVVVNYANGDMVGHTGIVNAAIHAVDVLDECIGKLVKTALEKNYDVLITADHGNCEEMVNHQTGEPMTQHTTNPVPLIWIGNNSKGKKLKNGILADLAPTILKIYGWPQPVEMTGQALN
ncbi:MAG: 2,3-bisphosphoglycerate-independent phosphoglycerate mutase [Bdellovibrionales bacterium]